MCFLSSLYAGVILLFSDILKGHIVSVVFRLQPAVRDSMGQIAHLVLEDILTPALAMAR